MSANVETGAWADAEDDAPQEQEIVQEEAAEAAAPARERGAEIQCPIGRRTGLSLARAKHTAAVAPKMIPAVPSKI